MFQASSTHPAAGGPRRVALATIGALLAAVAVAPVAHASVNVTRVVEKVKEEKAQVKAETVTIPQVGQISLNKVGIVEISRAGEKAKNVLVLEPGTSAAAAYFVPFAKSLVEAVPGWQVWAVERRENFLENQAVLTKYKFGELPREEENPNTQKEETPPEQFFNFYLGYLGQDEARAAKEAEASILFKVLVIAAEEALKETGGVEPAYKERIIPDAERYAETHGAQLAAEGKVIGEKIFEELVAAFKNHYEPVKESLVGFAKNWGMARAVEDLKVVIGKATKLHGKVVLGGHSLGGSVVTAYATWDFNGKPGASGLSGLVYDDGGSSPFAVSEEEAKKSLENLDRPTETPWLAFGGIPAPDLGLFSATGSTLTVVEPKGPSLLEKFPFLPSDLRGPITPVTNEAGFGFSVNVGTSPAALIAAQIHGGAGVEATAEMDGLHGWNGSGALTPLGRYAEMLSGTGLREMSGSEWYFPARLTLDTGAVGNGLANPAQAVLGLHSTMGEDLPATLKILAIDSELDKVFGGSQTTLTEAEALAAQSKIPTSNLTLIEEENTYAHNDPAGASSEINEFFKQLVPFLKGIAE